MKRRTVIAAGSIGTLLASAPSWALSPHSLSAAAEEVYIYGLPLIEAAASRAASFASGATPNHLFHDRRLATPAFRSITTPNNDTLYSRAWINLGGGPITIEIPKMGERYFSLSLLDMYGNVFAIVGTRTVGGDGTAFTLAGPDDGRGGFATITAPTRHVWLLARTLVDGENDLAAVHALQDGLRLVGPDQPMPPAYASRAAPWSDLLASIQALVAANLPPLTDGAVFERLASLGIGPAGGFDAGRFSASDTKLIEAGIAAGRARIAGARRQGGSVNGWAYPKPNIGLYGQDYLYRGQVALGGLGALPRVEAMYMRAVRDDGLLHFAPGQTYRMRFAAGGLPPVDSFWSITMYERTEAGQFFLSDNPEGRYAIGDRTSGLAYGADGSLDLWIGPDRPRAGVANWLPAPANRPWGLVFRAYLPKDALLSGDYRLPPLEPVTGQ